jgi:hypothetical protein
MAVARAPPACEVVVRTASDAEAEADAALLEEEPEAEVAKVEEPVALPVEEPIHSISSKHSTTQVLMAYQWWKQKQRSR